MTTRLRVRALVTGGDRLARFLDPPSAALDATDEVWRFFARH